MTIYIELMNEGTNCWRPVEAKDLGDGRFQIISSQPEDEDWQFKPDDIVECRKKHCRTVSALSLTRLLRKAQFAVVGIAV